MLLYDVMCVQASLCLSKNGVQLFFSKILDIKAKLVLCLVKYVRLPVISALVGAYAPLKAFISTLLVFLGLESTHKLIKKQA